MNKLSGTAGQAPLVLVGKSARRHEKEARQPTPRVKTKRKTSVRGAWDKLGLWWKIAAV